jgi:hypothetical protein
MTVPLPAGGSRRSAYTGRVTNWPMVLLSAVLAVPFVAVQPEPLGSPHSRLVVAVVAGVVVLNVLTAASLRTTVGVSGVSFRFGVLGWPCGSYRLDDVERAQVVEVSPWQVALGFWWTPRGTSCTVRPGPALRLRLTSGRTVTLSVPDPQTAVAVLGEIRPS